jgi:hypothetical protein
MYNDAGVGPGFRELYPIEYKQSTLYKNVECIR